MTAALSAVFGSALAAILLATASAVALGLGFLWWVERRRVRDLERQLADERRHAEAAERAANHFFDLVSHELRSPIASIVGYQELLSDGVYGDTGKGASEPLERIRRSADHLLHLIDGVVDLARLRTGELAAQPETVELQPLLQDVAQEFARGAVERGIPHQVRLDHDLPAIRSDPQRLLRALHLMVIVAEKHPDGHGRSMEFSATGDGDGLTVRIQGTRIPQQPDARDPALRSGIRISIAAAMAQLLGGSLRLESDDHHTVTGMTLEVTGL
jgi:signal transduction histidine kinase